MAQDFVAIIDYGSGNLRSAAKAFEHVIAAHGLNMRVKITEDPRDIAAASHIVLPGQGAFGDCIKGLKNVSGMIEALEAAVLGDKTPFLGICVGMQLLADRGFEHGTHQGLGWIEGDIVPMKPSDQSLKIPHMGWNTVHYTPKAHEMGGLFDKSDKKDPYFYFVHSFMFQSKGSDNILGYAQYGGDVPAIIGRGNIIGVQFHPEKSGADGLDLLHRFLCWDSGSLR